MIYKKILDTLKEKVSKGGKHIILADGTKAVIDPNNFKPLPQAENKTISFVDGGNAELLGAANFSLQFIRVYSCTYKDNKRIASQKKEFYSLITAKNVSGKIVYDIENFDTDLTVQEINSLDPKLTNNHRLEPAQVGELVRKYAELKHLTELTADIIVRDGDLEAQTDQEKQCLAQSKGKTIIGLAKTVSLLTDAGNSAVTVLNAISPQGSWYYPCGSTGFAKFHPASKHVFRIDHYGDVRTALGALQQNSIDPVFIGYPYGLIEADKLARVSSREAQQLKLVFLTKGGEKFRLYLSSKDAHDILNIVS